MRAISTRKTTTLVALVFLLGHGGTTFAAPRDVRRFPRPGAPSYKRPWIGEACKQEFSTYCSSLPSNARREAIVDCLKQHAEDLSPSCTEAISDRPEGMDTPPSGGRNERRRQYDVEEE
jgi:hypothetical protein